MKSPLVPVIIMSVIVIIGSIALYNIVKPTQLVNDNQSQLKKFSSVDELKNYLKENSQSSFNSYNLGQGSIGEGNVRETISPQSSMSVGKSVDYSTTNIQVEGVDEADIIKNDEKYIYTVSNNKVVIIQAYPAEAGKIVAEIDLNGSTPSQLFVNKDKLVIFASQNIYYVQTKAIEGIKAPDYDTSKTMVYVYDISDRSNPILRNDYILDGYYYNSRMIGNYVYTITNQAIYNFENPIIPEPVYKCAEAKCFDLWYFDRSDSGHQFTIITSIDLESDKSQTKVFLLGYSQNLYVSENNIYIVYSRQLSINNFLEKIIGAINPLIPSEVQIKIKDIENSNLFSNDEKMSAIGRVLNNYSTSLSPDARLEFQKKFEKAFSQVQEEVAKEMERTIIHKISIQNGNIDYNAEGEVPGYTLNQFSMDEYNGNFRVATTTEGWTQKSKNHIYVLDDSLKTIGKLEDLASGEKIYSVRFLGNKAYMVTFRQIDPLFVIDLTPNNPKVLGFLKITGVSDYIHPYDENHIIGLGRDATEEGRVKGLKIALFDVSDLEDPKEISKVIIGEQGAYSEALYDHKAFLFSKEKNLLVIPASVTENNTYNAFQGAYVFHMNLEDGISLKGRITHEKKTNETYYYYNYGLQITRSLYIGNILYTLSQKLIKANSLDNLKEVNSINISEENDYPYPIPVPLEEPVMPQ
ncbi:MAG: beta-propeller domain-containing protein [Candidatus Aenigmarchaeota archaeon]|nr:beta-propeller domain-containing protein [Candidatus Aenigmarchaeota archaeon]